MALGDVLRESRDEILHSMNTLSEPPCDKDISASTQGQTNPSNRILFVDDSIAVREASAKVLTCSGYDVDVAEDGEAGWKALHAASYDLLITDHNMPKLSGVELVKKLRSAHMKLPVVLASAALPTEELSQIPWLQLAATLLKPFSIDELLQTVKEILGAAHNANVYAGPCFPVLVEAVIPIEPPRWRSLPPSDDIGQNG
jgi:two-component system chemotaxis response regulator CheY